MYRLIIYNVFVTSSNSITDLFFWAIKHGYPSFSIESNGSEVYSVEHITVKRW